MTRNGSWQPTGGGSAGHRNRGRSLVLRRKLPSHGAACAQGAAARSLVAAPLREDNDRFTLRKDSPAWALGFERIPVERIGPQPE